MVKTPELTAAQRTQLAGELQSLQEQLADQLVITSEDSAPVVLDQQMVGRLSRMDAIAQQHMAQANLSQLKAHLAQVKRALVALSSGDYGYCRHCDEPIGFARLQARPDSPLCIACQSAAES